jgi:hypothetical protein
MIDGKDSNIPLPLIIFSCIPFSHAPLEWQYDQSVPLETSKSQLIAHRPDDTSYVDYRNDSANNGPCCAAIGHKLQSSPGNADTDTFLLNIWNILPES